MTTQQGPPGRRERAKEEKRRRITAAATALFAEHGVGGVTTQQIADRADVAIGTLFLYAATKAELLIMVQNEKFETALDEGLAAAADLGARSTVLGEVLALLTPAVTCLREQPENGRTYLHELVFGDPAEPHRAEGLALSLRLEDGVTRALSRDRSPVDAATLARVISSVLHVTTTATLHLHDALPEVLDHLRRQVAVVLPRPE
ncbi:TetR family transcriptional regulator [Rathayibacter sp. VKM Ac-2803]|uniref:TetR/AcrR family transcriptional regulator n=1 Tax=Rathayibacter sp. VKM Ac-2803 TaxID=2609256 RepID=UPI0013569E54|nr:TetR/AcrR family transcriptional regulator [Rathayibacter sp. VKM Ac-2803]MWV48047.1 TetR family transcriptional regulator [Rathayibacter sp. VKM Ac-2803]